MNMMISYQELVRTFLRSDLYRLISDRDYLYRADYGALEKAGIVAKNTRS